MIQPPSSNPNPIINNFFNNYDDLGFELSDYLAFEDQLDDDYTCNFISPLSNTPVILQENNGVILQAENNTSTESSLNSNQDDMDSSHAVQT